MNPCYTAELHRAWAACCLGKFPVTEPGGDTPPYLSWPYGGEAMAQVTLPGSTGKTGPAPQKGQDVPAAVYFAFGRRVGWKACCRMEMTE